MCIFQGFQPERRVALWVTSQRVSDLGLGGGVAESRFQRFVDAPFGWWAGWLASWWEGDESPKPRLKRKGMGWSDFMEGSTSSATTATAAVVVVLCWCVCVCTVVDKRSSSGSVDVAYSEVKVEERWSEDCLVNWMVGKEYCPRPWRPCSIGRRKVWQKKKSGLIEENKGERSTIYLEDPVRRAGEGDTIMKHEWNRSQV